MAGDDVPSRIEKKPKRRGGSKSNKPPVHSRPLRNILKQVAPPTTSIGRNCMHVMSGIMEDLQERAIAASFKLAQLDAKGTLKAKHVHGACDALLSGGLSASAIKSGTAAVNKYTKCT